MFIINYLFLHMKLIPIEFIGNLDHSELQQSYAIAPRSYFGLLDNKKQLEGLSSPSGSPHFQVIAVVLVGTRASGYIKFISRCPNNNCQSQRWIYFLSLS